MARHHLDIRLSMQKNKEEIDKISMSILDSVVQVINSADIEAEQRLTALTSVGLNILLNTVVTYCDADFLQHGKLTNEDPFFGIDHVYKEMKKQFMRDEYNSGKLLKHLKALKLANENLKKENSKHLH